VVSRRALIVSALFVVTGCTMVTDQATRALAEADARMARNDYLAASAAYDAYLLQFPDDAAAPRVRAVRAVIGELAALRAERDRLAAREAQLVREGAAREAQLTRDGASRDAELTKLRQELAARQAETARLKDDLEALKRTDLQMERRRR
jgi:hypothetical protein